MCSSGVWPAGATVGCLISRSSIINKVIWRSGTWRRRRLTWLGQNVGVLDLYVGLADPLLLIPHLLQIWALIIPVISLILAEFVGSNKLSQTAAEANKHQFVVVNWSAVLDVLQISGVKNTEIHLIMLKSPWGREELLIHYWFTIS